MSIQTPEEEKITDFVLGMTDSLRTHDYALYDLLIRTVPGGFYRFSMQPTTLIMGAVRVR